MSELEPTGLVEVADSMPARQRLVLALDLDDLALARRLAQRLAPWFATVKVGLELFSSAGPVAVSGLVDDGFDVFLDLKLHDIPVTVHRAARVLGRLGARYLSVHVAGGRAMLEGAVEGLALGAADAGMAAPVALGVTVLTSEKDAPRDVLTARAALAAFAGCGGIVCAAPDLEAVRAAAPGLLTVVPGTRLHQVVADDQARVAAPGEAIAHGADLLVVGRPVTASERPEIAAAEIAASIFG
jgi:orotidine-5'-phosphate decarboxylase